MKYCNEPVIVQLVTNGFKYRVRYRFKSDSIFVPEIGVIERILTRVGLGPWTDTTPTITWTWFTTTDNVTIAEFDSEGAARAAISAAIDKYERDNAPWTIVEEMVR